jgi:RimJ/RimL family protein N-acetyltransferase
VIGGDRLPTIASERLNVRWLTPADVDALFAIFSDAEVMAYWSSLPMRSRGEAAEYVEEIHAHFATKTLFQWGIARKEDDLVIGTCTLFSLSAPNHRAEIGYALGRPHWGRGYAHEAVTAVIQFGWETLGLHRLEADVDPRNARSIRCLERLGFQREGFARERWLVGGKWFDSVLMGLVRS